MKVLDLFSGIGGFGLAARWAGFQTVQFVEIDPFCQQVLAKNFPGVPIHGDIRTFRGDGIDGVDLLTGGFPCQDISLAGKGAGIEGERSGLWSEMFRVILECRPRFCLIENVPALRNRGADRVLSDLEGAGYTAGSFVVGADDIGATHRRKRVWIVACCNVQSGIRGREFPQSAGSGREARPEPARRTGELAYPESGGSIAFRQADELRVSGTPDSQRQPLADADDNRELQPTGCECDQWRRDRDSLPRFPPARNDFRGWAAVASVDAALMPCVEREVRGVATRLPRRLDGITGSLRNHRLKALGNAIVPDVAFLFLKWIATQLEETR